MSEQSSGKFIAGIVCMPSEIDPRPALQDFHRHRLLSFALIRDANAKMILQM